MKKFIIVFVTLLLIFTISFTSYKFIKKDKSNDTSTKITESKIENKENLIEENTVIENVEKSIDTTNEEIVNKTESTDKDSKKNTVTSKKEETVKETKSNENIVVNESTVKDEDIPKVVEREVEQEVADPKNDSEYKELKKIFRYETSSECFIASNEAYDLYMDDENFYVTTCETKSYKGELVGWGVVIYFNDNTKKYY